MLAHGPTPDAPRVRVEGTRRTRPVPPYRPPTEAPFRLTPPDQPIPPRAARFVASPREWVASLPGYDATIGEVLAVIIQLAGTGYECCATRRKIASLAIGKHGDPVSVATVSRVLTWLRAHGVIAFVEDRDTPAGRRIAFGWRRPNPSDKSTSGRLPHEAPPSQPRDGGASPVTRGRLTGAPPPPIRENSEGEEIVTSTSPGDLATGPPATPSRDGTGRDGSLDLGGGEGTAGLGPADPAPVRAEDPGQLGADQAEADGGGEGDPPPEVLARWEAEARRPGPSGILARLRLASYRGSKLAGPPRPARPVLGVPPEVYGPSGARAAARAAAQLGKPKPPPTDERFPLLVGLGIVRLLDDPAATSPYLPTRFAHFFGSRYGDRKPETIRHFEAAAKILGAGEIEGYIREAEAPEIEWRAKFLSGRFAQGMRAARKARHAREAARTLDLAHRA